jgi:hypothetical protein
MKKNIFYFSAFILLIFNATKSSAQVELVNFEETWQKFLSDPLSSQVSKLRQPEKTNVIDNLKYCLMYANNYFCSDNIKSANEKIQEIKGINETEHAKIPGFKERFDDLTQKVDAYYKIDALWGSFIKNHNISFADLDKIPQAKSVCEKGTLAKYSMMVAYLSYCKFDLPAVKAEIEVRLTNLFDKTNFDINKVSGLSTEFKAMKENLRVNALLDPAWKEYIATDKSPGFTTDLQVVNCNVVPNLKIYVLRAMVDVCKYGSEMLPKIKELQKINTQTLPVELQNKIDWLDQEVTKYTGNLVDLNKAWSELISTDKVSKGLNYKGIFCEKDAQIKSYLIEGWLEPCTKGEEMLKKIEDVQKEFNPTLDNTTKDKISKLEAKVKKENENVELFKKAWEEFTTNDTNVVNTKFPFEYCDKEMIVQAYIMDGRLAPCERGANRVADVNKLLSSNKIELGAKTTDKLNYLQQLVDGYNKTNKELTEKWKVFVENNDTIAVPYDVDAFYCDKIMQVKSWCLMGHFNTCKQGQSYLSKIDSFQKKHNLNYDPELACRVTRLRLKVWDCRYWELVELAWKETHEERERFGPKSAEIMFKDLNGPKQVCETKVEYEPLFKIGIKYVIKIYLCQEVDLAQMGDPEYYKKIAKWIDTEVLVKYCAPDMRCKKDFTIYIEGHTDGNPFSYYKYKTPLNIPKGTAFTHFLGKTDPVEKTTERELTYELKSNLELGLGRAWTVKKQLDFMGVPFTIGAYEHPAKEKGGEFRRMEVELNMPNLLLDFFEKRLKILLDESGIGPQPKNCKS